MADAGQSTLPPAADAKRPCFAAGVVMLATLVLIVYLPTLRGDFLWDDDAVLTNNPLIHSPQGLYDFWFTTKAPDYWPLTGTSLWLEWRLWGRNPTGYHVSNVVLHLLSSLLLWTVLRRLHIGEPGAWLGALLFAVHPVNVESVAWITQRKNTLSMVLYLLSALAFINVLNGRGRRWYALSLTAFVLGMLSKASIVIMPAAMLIGAIRLHGKLTKQYWRLTAPFFAVAGLLTAVNIWFQTHRAIQTDVVRDDGMLSRLAGAGAAVWFYLSKALLPRDLMFVYPRWQIDIGDWRWWVPLALLGLLFTALRLGRHRLGSGPLLAMTYFVLGVLPAAGFINIYFMKYSLVADHWQYVAILGVVALAGGGFAVAWRRWPRSSAAAALAIVAAMTFTAWRHAHHFRDVETLWRHTIERNPHSWIAHHNLASHLGRQGRMEEALEHYREAVRIRPDFADAYYGLGSALDRLQQHEQAISHYQLALSFNDRDADTWNNLGNALANLRRDEEAMQAYRRAIALRPRHVVALNNLGNALLRKDRLAEAAEMFRAAMAVRDDFAAAHNGLGNTLARMGEFDGAIGHFREAVRLESDNQMFRENLRKAEAAKDRR